MSSKNGEVSQRIADVQREMRIASSFGALYSHAVAERVGMHSTDIETMDLLGIFGSMSAGQLSELTGLTTGATTRLIDRLERVGFVRRVADPRDRRRVIIELIMENLGHIAELYEPMSETLGEAWSQFSAEELEVVLRFARASNAAVADANVRLRSQASV